MDGLTLLAMEASELQRMIPALQLEEELYLQLIPAAQNNPFSLSFKFGFGFRNDEFQINLPREEGRFHPSCHEFLNSVLCSFLHNHTGNKLRSLYVTGSRHIPQFLSNLLAALGGKGITNLNLLDYAGDLSSDQDGLDSLFRPLISLCVRATEAQIEDSYHSELGRLISLSSNLEQLWLISLGHLSDAGFINIMNGVHSLQKIFDIHLCVIQLDQFHIGSLERFFDILKSLPSLNHLYFHDEIISLEGTRATVFWTQLLQLPNFSLSLDDCTIPDSVAPLIRNLLAGPKCRVTNLALCYDDEAMRDSTAMLEGIYNGVALNQSIQSLEALTSRFVPQDSQQLCLAICNMMKVNTTLTRISLVDCDHTTETAQTREYFMYFNALRHNQKLTDVAVDCPNKSMDKEAAGAIGSYLESSTVLEKFSLRCTIDPELAAQICKGARRSKSLTKLYVSHVPVACLKLFVELLAQNSNIVDAKFGTFESDRIDYLLAWNQCGRKHLLDLSFPTNLLPLVFARQSGKHAASCIYACLRECPYILSTAVEK